MSRLLHENALVRVGPCRHGLMTWFRHDAHVGRALEVYGEWAEAEVELLRAFLGPGKVAVDVGANIGTHAVAMAQAVGPTGLVLAFEPQRAVHQVLCANAALNGLLQLKAFHAALGAQAGGVVVPEVDYAEPGNFGGVPLGAWTQGETVPVLTLDGFALPRCDVLKVDVEGMEAAVLAGAQDTLRRCQPVVYFENNGPAGAPEVVRQLRALGYVLAWHFSPFFRAQNFLGATDDVFGGTVDANVLAVPAAMAGVVRRFLPVEADDEPAATALRRQRG